ncbi:MAG: type II toxin-antitoxin system VapC family toxin [Desulfocucumaceae bacterium]
METVLVSSVVILALLDADSPLHRKAVEGLEGLRDRGASPLLTNFIVAETFSMLASVLGPDAGRTWLRHNIWPVERVSEADEERAREIILEQESGCLKAGNITYIAATSMAVMERLGAAGILSFDPAAGECGMCCGTAK